MGFGFLEIGSVSTEKNEVFIKVMKILEEN